MPGSRAAASSSDAEESPGSTKRGWRVTPAGPGLRSRVRDSATESRPPMTPDSIRGQARVKGCGKSAPRGWQQSRHGKPHPEQDRIGAGRPFGDWRVSRQSSWTCARPGWSLERHGNMPPRGMAASAALSCPWAGNGRRYRTRLTGSPAHTKGPAIVSRALSFRWQDGLRPLRRPQRRAGCTSRSHPWRQPDAAVRRRPAAWRRPTRSAWYRRPVPPPACAAHRL